MPSRSVCTAHCKQVSVGTFLCFVCVSCFVDTADLQYLKVLFEKLRLHERCENKKLPKTTGKQQQSTSEAAVRHTPEHQRKHTQISQLDPQISANLRNVLTFETFRYGNVFPQTSKHTNSSADLLFLVTTVCKYAYTVLQSGQLSLCPFATTLSFLYDS